MISNEGRNIYLHEILIDYLKHTEEYTDDNIKKKLQKYYDLQDSYNIDKDNLSREDRVLLKRLKAFFFKTFQISFANSNLIYPRFEEAYKQAKDAISNLKTAYDNVIKEYYNIANNGYYEYKDPRFLNYLKYIKKKIITAKVNAGIIDYDSKMSDDNTAYNNPEDLKITDEKPRLGEDKIYDHHQSLLDKFDISSERQTDGAIQKIRELSPGEIRPYVIPQNITIPPNANQPGANQKPSDNIIAPTQQQTLKKSRNNFLIPPPPFFQNSSDKIIPEQESKQQQTLKKSRNNFLIPPPPFLESSPATLQQSNTTDAIDSRGVLSNINTIQQGFLELPNIEKLILQPPYLLGGAIQEPPGIKQQSNDLKLPMTLKEKYTVEEKYINNLLIEFDDIIEYTKIIDDITSYIDELHDFIYGRDENKEKKLDKVESLEKKIKDLNVKKKDDDIKSTINETSSLKNDIIKYETSTKLQELIKDGSDFKKKEKKFLSFLEKIPKELYNKDNEIYLKKIEEIKKTIEENNLKTLINDFNKYIKTAENDFKEALKQFKNKATELENNLKLELSEKNKFDIEKQKAEMIRVKINPLQVAAQAVVGQGGSGILGGEGGNEKLINDIHNTKTAIKNKKIELETIFKDIQRQIKFKSADPLIKTTLNNTSDGEPYVPGISIFDKIWKNYTTDLKDDKKLIEVVEDKLYTNIKNNNLDPLVVLELTTEDKLIFIVIIFFIRQISLGIVEYYIDIGKIKDIIYSLMFYVICYTIMIIILTIFINLDNYKLRIIFNYFNLHINMYNIITHILIVSIFAFLIYSLFVIINFPIQNINQKYISETDKIKLSYRLDILTMIIYVFSAIFVILV